MSAGPLVSVIIPAYNCAEFIRDAIDSVLRQRSFRVEIIVVNDGSTDDTKQVLRSYGDDLVVIDQPNGGVACARNRGLMAARGEYVAFLDADDVWLPDKLDMQVGYMEMYRSVGMVYSDWRVWRPDEPGGDMSSTEFCRLPEENVEIEKEGSGWIYGRLLSVDCIVHTSTVVLRKSLAEHVGYFDSRLARGEDYDYWFRVSRVSEINKIKRVLSLYRIRPDSMVRTSSATHYEVVVVKRALERWGREGPDGVVVPRKLIRRRLSGLWFSFGYDHAKRGNHRLATVSFVKSLAYRPLWHAPLMHLSATMAKWIGAQLRRTAGVLTTGGTRGNHLY